MNRRKILKNGLFGILGIPVITSNPLRNMNDLRLDALLMQRYPGIRRNIKSSVWDGLSEEDVRKRPADMNSIVWNIWHMARAEDVGINRLVTDGQQVFDQSDWMGNLNIDIRHFGTGMTKEEVESLSNSIDIEALKNYHEAVGEQTTKVFKKVADMPLYENLDKDYLHKVMIDEGVLHKNALWVEEFYQTKQKAWFLVHMGLTHSFEHLGQLMLIRKLLGYKATR
ncbi:DinB family protein [Croceitalea rosinachiae]|uniref:DinB family protein n=1 Tax=Croceitalea rosinachiae TaxID=3075596 RepID=A0ABU3ADQ7_9FLAO|nr:DinB family protein [Croceitalea sp. F388]MDT0608319.1 DinB family protein [Croceitalea sp. F388]